MDTNKKVPSLRFRGFIEEWEEKKLVDLTSLITKGTTPLNKSSAGSINFIKIENINPSSGLIQSLSKITEEEHFGYLKRSQLKENDILFSIAGTLGRVTIVKKDVLPANINQALAIVRLKNTSLDYKNTSLDYIGTFLKGEAITSYIKKNPTIGAQPNLSLAQVESFCIPIPCITEQDQIGNYFKELDGLIRLQEQKYERLTQLKKAMLEKMFPKGGADAPEIRLKGFTDKWEEKKLGEVAKFSKGMGYSKNDIVSIGSPIVLYGRLYTRYQTEISEIDTYAIPNKKSIYSKGNEVIIPASGESSEDIARASAVLISGIILGSDLNVVIPDKLINPTFLALTLTFGNAKYELSKRAKGKSVVHIHNSDLKDVLFFYPTLPEQQKISGYFQKLDQLICQSQLQIEKYKNIKQALLTKMFI